MTNENPDASIEQPPDNGRGRPNAIVGADRVLQRRVFTLNAGAAAGQVGAVPAIIDRQALGFMAATIRIDNLSHQWYYIRGVEQWVPAGQVGMVIRCNQLEVADVRALTPTGFTSAPVDGETVVIVFEESRFEPNAGFNLFIAGGLLPPDTPSDEEANQAGMPVVAFNKVWNPNAGTSGLWTRMFAGVVGVAQTLTGKQNVLPMMRDAVGSVANLTAMSFTGLYTHVLSVGLWINNGGAPSPIKTAAQAGDADTGAFIIEAANSLFNGTAYERLRSILASLATPAVGTARVASAYNPTAVAAAATTVIKATPGIAHAINFNAVTTGVITLQDNATVIATFPVGTAAGTRYFDAICLTNITVVEAAADPITVLWL